MKKNRLISLSFVVIISLCLFVSCTNSGSSLIVTGLKEDNTLQVGSITNFDISFKDGNSYTYTVTSSNNQVIMASGTALYALDTGKSIITITCAELKEEKELNITVIEAKEIYDKAPEELLIIGKQETMQKNSSIKVNVYVGTNYASREVIWESSDEEIATVKDGVITAHKEGKVIIKANSVFSSEEKELKDSFELTVEKVDTMHTFSLSLKILLQGMVAIFVAIAIIFVAIVTLNKVTSLKSKK